MCTLIVLHRCVAGRPLVVAANRDEFLHRPAEDVALRSSRTGPILSPLDLEAGGTWVGLSQRGVFAGLTNLRPLNGSATGNPSVSAEHGQEKPAQEMKSRGGVVMAALEAESAADAVRALNDLEEAAYNPFQLIVADGRDAWLIVYRDRPRAIELEHGAHIVGNVEDERVAAVLGTTEILERGAGSGTDSDGSSREQLPGFEGVEGLLVDLEEPRALKLTRIRERVEKLVMEPGLDLDLFEGLAGICREHVAEQGIQSPFEATCVHIADRYGTRSSLLLELSEDSDAHRMWTTDGPPCERPFDNRSSLLKDLGVRLGS